VTGVSHLCERLFAILASIAALTLLAMVALVTADIVMRNTLGTGFAWSNEVTEYALYIITLFTAPWLLRRGQHVRIDMFLVIVPPRVAWAMEAAADILGFAATLLLVWYGAAMTARVMADGLAAGSTAAALQASVSEPLVNATGSSFGGSATVSVATILVTAPKTLVTTV